MATEIKTMQYKVEITTLCEKVETADDTVVAGQGLVAYNALIGRHDITIINADGTEVIFIPFHAVCHAKVTITEATETVEDETCQSGD